MIFVFILAAIVIGTLMPVQAAINAEFTRFLKHPYLAAIVSLFTGALLMSCVLIIQGLPTQELKRLTEAPPRLFLGGLLGAVFVSSSMFFIPRMGATAMIGAFITGQLLMSVLMDHFGLLGLAAQPVSFSRIVGVLLLFSGLLLVVKKT